LLRAKAVKEIFVEELAGSSNSGQPLQHFFFTRAALAPDDVDEGSGSLKQILQVLGFKTGVFGYAC
jgi:hypothetical protein